MGTLGNMPYVGEQQLLPGAVDGQVPAVEVQLQDLSWEAGERPRRGSGQARKRPG